ncbi:hypothetical protein [Nonomuraea sp. SYSU D8015]|nr:hypothetical protein [Nonomuraea sp. SYSU D8015]
MVCPECPGCGCYDGRCSGWRHREYMRPDDLAEREAAEAGGRGDGFASGA